MNKLKELFYPSPEKIKEFQYRIAQITERSRERRKIVKLIKHNYILYKAEPFDSFLGDCQYCKSYQDSMNSLVIGGKCIKHNIACGYGFTCKDNTYSENDNWDEFKRILEK